MTLMPVRSPLGASAIAAGIATALSGPRAAAARSDVERVLAGGPERRALLLDSGTSALTLALKLTASPAGRAVALPAFACYDIATAADGAGVPFVLYDIDPTTLGPDLDSLRAALASGADRVVVVHLYGIPVDLSAVMGLAEEFGATLIEDAAQGAGALWRGEPLGRRGSLAVLSFGRGKGVTAGRGGALVANDTLGRLVLDHAARSLRPSGSSVAEFVSLTAQWLLARRSVYWLPASLPFLRLGETTYHPPHPAQVASALAVGVLSETMRSMTSEADTRRRHAARLSSALSSTRWSTARPPSAGVPGFLRLPVLGRRELDSVELRTYRRLGIMPSYPIPLSELPGFGARDLGGAGTLSGAQELSRRLLTLPVHGALTESDLTRLERWCRA